VSITLEQAIEIHARVMTLRFKGGAYEKACEWARALSGNGDLQGEAVWLSVADAIDRMTQLREPAAPTVH